MLAALGKDHVGQGPMVGAIYVKNQQIITKGFHQKFLGLHAEFDAFKDQDFDVKGATLYVTLEPCAMCCGAMLHARVKRVVFGAADPKTGMAGSVGNVFSIKQINHQTEVQGGVLAEECGELLREFFRQRRI